MGADTIPRMNDDNTQWIVTDCDESAASRLADEAGVAPIVARLLIKRGVTTAEEAARFLSPSLDHLHDPALLPDIDAGIDRVTTAMSRGEKICVHGDYDVDGITSTALLVRALRALKAEVTYRLPHRRNDGYGIKPPAVDEAAADGASVIVTCDCGITAHDAVARAKDLGIDVIVTDHHEPGPELPDATAVINPKRADAGYPFPELAGVGVAFKFAQGLVRKLGYDEGAFCSKFVDLAALGTVADVVPLVDENRTLVKFGLEAIPSSKKVGLRTMLKCARLVGKPLNSYSLAFILGPRINAVGRMEDASAALELFLTRDEAEAHGLASQLERCNSERKAEQDRIMAEAVELLDRKNIDPGSSPGLRVIVLSREGWNSGVIGIVAGKICETYGRPAILISRDEASGMGRGSARGIDAFNLYDALCACSTLLGRFGGHALAAGLSIPLANLDEFEERINALGLEQIPEEELLPRIELEGELAPTDITRDLACALASMEPFGTGNPEPLFMTRNLAVVRRERVGDGSHLKMLLQGDGAHPVSCIAFRMGELADTLQLGSAVDLCYSIRLNTFNGTESVEVVAKAIRNSNA